MVRRCVLVGPCLGREAKRLLRVERVPSRGDFLIGVDGGAALPLPFDVAIGDWDSLGKRRLPPSLPKITLETKKSRSDLYSALQFARATGAKEVLALGLTGGRPDHHLASLFELSQCTGLRVTARDPEAAYYFVASKQKTALRLSPGRLFSVFALSGVARVDLRGAEYVLRNTVLRSGSHGLSNVARGRVVVESRAGNLLVVVPTGLI